MLVIRKITVCSIIAIESDLYLYSNRLQLDTKEFGGLVGN